MSAACGRPRLLLSMHCIPLRRRFRRDASQLKTKSPRTFVNTLGADDIPTTSIELAIHAWLGSNHGDVHVLQQAGNGYADDGLRQTLALASS
jgi:hypothetical protein